MVQSGVPGDGPRVRRRQREILRAASEEFRERGFHATGMRDIARRLGMTVGNLYYYFRNKEALLAFCQRQALERLLSLARWVRELELGAHQRLYLLVVGHVVCLNEGTPGSLAHLEVEELGADWRAVVVAERDAYEAQVRQLIEEGVAEGSFAPTDVRVAAWAVLGAVNWTVKWFRTDGAQDARAIGRQFATPLVRGLMVGGADFEPPSVEIPDFEGVDDPGKREGLDG